jgi:hypothetical protein
MGFTEKWIGKSMSQGITREDVQSFVARELQENLSLEYKSIATLKEPQKLRKAICALANSDGGLIIVGVSEKKSGGKHLPGKLEWSDNPAWNKEWLQDVTLNQIRPPIRGVQILPVSNSANGTLFLIEVPASTNPPHMADGAYYFRNAAESLPMEHYQVADAFGKRLRPILKPRISLSFFDSGNNTVKLTYSVANLGHSLAKWIMAYLTFKPCNKLESTDETVWQKVRQEQSIDGVETWIAGYESPILVLHPGMVKTLGEVRVHLASPLALISITVGAEGSTTDSYLTLISREWLMQRASEPNYQAKTELHIPTLACGPHFNLDELEQFRKFEEPVMKDLERMPPELAATVVGTALLRIGDDAILTVLQRAQALVEKENLNPSSSVQ